MASAITAAQDPSLGTDVDTFLLNDEGVTDLDPNFGLLNGPKAIAQSVARLWLSDPGSLITNEAAGRNIRNLLSAEFDDRPESLAHVRALLAAEARREERVEDIAVDLTFDTANESLKVSATIQPADPSITPFSFVLTISKVTSATILEVSE